MALVRVLETALSLPSPLTVPAATYIYCRWAAPSNFQFLYMCTSKAVSFSCDVFHVRPLSLVVIRTAFCHAFQADLAVAA